MSMFEISRAQGTKALEAVEPGTSVVINSGDRILCDQSFTEVSSVTRIDNNLQLIIADNPPVIFNQFFSAQNSLIQFKDQQFTTDDLKNALSVHLTSTDSNQLSHEIFLSPGSAVLAQAGENYYLNSTEFNIKDLHRHGKDLLIQSHDEAAKIIAIVKDFFSQPETGLELPQLHVIDPTGSGAEDMIVHPHSSIFQWEGEPLPIAVVGSLYGYYFQLEGSQAQDFNLVSRTDNGDLPSWMTFSNLGNGKYYLSGVPTSAAVGNHEIFIDAYCIKNKIRFHTQQSFDLTIKSSDDTTTRAAIDEVGTAEFRSLNEVLIAENYISGIVSVDQMPYMSMSEIAILASLAAVNPATFNQVFSTFATADQISHPEGLSDQAMLEHLNAIELDQIRNQMVSHESAGVSAPHVMMGSSNIEATTSGESAPSTETSTTPQTTSEPPPPANTDTQTSDVPPTNTPTVTEIPFSLTNTTVTHNLLISTPPPPPPPPTGPLFIDLGQPYNGFEFDGQTFAFLGRSANIVSDITGDGLDDLVVGVAYGALGTGNVYLVPGRVTPFPSQFNITNAPANSTDFTSSVASSFYNYKVADVSDYNGDGLSDLLIVTHGRDNVAYIVFGNAGGFPSSVDLNTFITTGGATEFTVTPPPFFPHTYLTNGASLGDVNGDGLGDFVLTNFSRNGFSTYTGTHVVFGTTTPPTTFDVSTVNGTNGFNLVAGTSHPSYVGLTGVDINGDGFNDVFVNTYGSTPYNNQIAVVFGRSTGFPSTIDPTNQPVGQGFIIHDSSVSDSNYIGFGVRDSANIGDVNNDGIDDVLIVEKNRGNAYVIFGDPNFSSISSFDVATLNGSNGFKLTSSTYDYMTQVAYVGDVNGDGHPDFGVVDAFAYDGKGAVHIIFGSANPFPAQLDLHNLARTEGFTIIGTDQFAGIYSVGGGGDLNGDGLSDIVISGWLINNRQGASYVIFGSNFDNVITRMGTSASETLTGTGGNDNIHGAGGNDIINALGGNDYIDAMGNSRIYAGQGNDTIVYHRDDAPVHGDTGTDTLWFKYDNTHVTFIGATNYTGIDAIDLMPMRTLVGNSVTLDAATVLSMSDANLMTITGNAHDILTLIATDFWTATSPIAGYTTYTSMSGSVVNVENDVHVTFAPAFAPVALNFTLSSLIDGVHGFSLTSTPDIHVPNATIMQNGDGFGDLLLGASINFSSSTNARTLLIDGQPTFHNNIPVTDSSLSEISFNNSAPQSPMNVYAAKPIAVSDFNGDGVNDFLISSIYGYPSILVLGEPDGFPANVPLSTIGNDGVTIFGGLGMYTDTAAALGDVNGDGLGDLIISNSRADFSAVVFGTTTPGASIDYQALDGTDGFIINRPNNDFNINLQDVGGGDITGDGLNDIFVSFWDTTAQIGGVGVILGESSAFSATVDVGLTGITGANGFIITNSAMLPGFDDILFNPTDIGNFTGSGIDSIALSSRDTVYVIFGNPTLSSITTFDLATLNGTNGFSLVGAGADQIYNIAYLSDVNGDGLADFGFVDSGAYGGLGAVYVIFGSQTAFPATINFTNLNSSQGFVITDPSINLSYASLGGGGDLNGDGLGDIVITSYGTEYIVFGQNFNGAITQMGTANQTVIQGVGSNDIIYAGSANHTIIGGAGNTFIDTGSGHDVVIGGTGTNTIVYSALNTQVYGGAGTSNTLWFKYDNTHVNFIGGTVYTGINIIDLRPLQDLTGNSVTLDASTVNAMSHGNTMTINGDAHDIVTLIATDMWTPSAVLAGYTTFTSQSGSVVNVDNDVHVTFAPPASPVTLNFTVPELTDGTHGFTLTNTTLLHATSSTIIQDGDGFDDLFIANGFSAGSSPYTRAFIIEGQPTVGASVPFDDPSLTTDVFNNTSFGVPISAYGQHVNSVGDFNGDGLQDILISEFFGGYSHIILGQPGGFLSTSLIATVGINLPGHFDATTSAALGDVNGDGLSDIALSDSQTGWGAVIFGTTTPGGSINTTALTGSDGFQIARPSSNISPGLQDIGTNDINGDGKNDIFVSYYDTSVNIGGIGVILGSTPAFSSTVTVSSAGISGADGFLITNSAGIPGSNDYLINPTEIGNFTGNGVDAVALSSKDTVYVIFGSTSFPTGGNFDVASINGTNGFELNTASHAANITSIAYLGDVNGDGLSDFGFLDSNAYSGLGAVYVVFGNTAPFSATPIDFTTMNSDQGFVITDPSGFTSNQTVAGILSAPTVSGGGDLNGDGLDEIVITSGSNQHIIYGQNFNGEITQLFDPNHSVIQGVGTHDVIYGSSGNDTITGGFGDSFISAGAGLDVINGGAGNNTIVYDGFDASVDGGLGGQNTLWLENDGIMADLQGTTIFKDFDVIDLRPLQSLQGNEVDLDPLGVSNMTHTNTLQVDGGAHDVLVLHDVGLDVWSVGPTVNIGGSLYTTYSSAVTNSTVYAENTLNHVSIV